jgi:nucleotide-binding universal stress UspA family protein
MFTMFSNVVVAYDGSAGARKALQVATELARDGDARLVAVAVEAHLPHYAATVGETEAERQVEERDARRWLTEASAYAAEQGVELATRTAVGHPAQAIARIAAELRADLVVIGHSGHSAAWGHFLGGVTEKVSRHAPCSVLIVRN